MAWHLYIPGYTSTNFLKNNYNLIEGGPDDWEVKAVSLSIRDEVISSSYLTEQVFSAFFYHKKPKGNVEHLQRIYSYLQNNFPDIRLLNTPYESKLFRSKIEFSRHVSQLPNAKSLLPEWNSLETEADLDRVIYTMSFPFLIKPDSLSGGKGIVKVQNKTEALKILRDSRNGIYNEDFLTKLKQFAKNMTLFETKTKIKNAPIKLLINEFIDTYHHKYKCYINATIYYWKGVLYFADVRVSNKGFNIHTGDSTYESLTREEYSKIISQVLRLIKRDSYKIKEMVNSLQ